MRLPARFLLLLAAAAAAQDASPVADRFHAHERTAFEHFERQEWDDAIAAFEKQISVFSGNPRPYYNIACAYALQGKAERAATWLSLAIDHGWRDAGYIAQDTDFDGVRSHAAFQKCLEKLAIARDRDPDPMPRRIDPAAVPSADSVALLLAASMLQQKYLEQSEPLLGAHDYRKQLFQIYDRRMAMLARYLGENGDARDGAEAARARVLTATGYLEAATGDAKDDRLRELAALYVVSTAEEFARAFAGSPFVAHVQLLRANAYRYLPDRRDDALATLRTLLADHPEDPIAPNARVQLCVLLADRGDRAELARVYAELETRHGADETVQPLMRGLLGKARLLVRGIPEGVPASPGLAVYAFVLPGDNACEEALRDLKTAGARPIVCCVGRRGPPPADWVEAHAQGLAVVPDANDIGAALWLNTVPTVIVARDREVLAVDPTTEELTKHLGASG